MSAGGEEKAIFLKYVPDQNQWVGLSDGCDQWVVGYLRLRAFEVIN